MKIVTPFCLLIFLLIVACKNDSEPTITDQNEIDDTTDDTTDIPNEPITSDVRMFIFGHSLINHEPPTFPTPSNETAVPHWVHFLAESAGFDYAANGQYGFLPQHRNLPPISQWGFDHVQSIWDSDIEQFQDADFNTILLTAGNFIQWQPASDNYFGDDFSPVDATLEILQWSQTQEEDLSLYIYENWPDMDPYLAGEFPNVTSQEFENYHNYTLGEFHQWWLDYHDLIISRMPAANVKMIPVGPVIANLLTQVDELSGLAASELYEDGAPHGRPTIYFLAGLVTYMAIYGTQASSDYVVPETVHINVRENYHEIVEFIWNELEEFNFEDGTSRVW